MFGKLKDKLKSFFSKEKAEEETKEKKVKKPTDKTKDKKKKEAKKQEEIPSDEELKSEAEKIPDSETIYDKKQDPTRIVSGNIEFGLQDNKEEILQQKKESFFSKFTKKISGTQTLKKEHIEEIFEPLEMILLENNVALEAVDKIHENLIKDLEGIEVKSGKIEETVKQSLKDSISSVLIEPPDLIKTIQEHHKKTNTPYTIVFFGINGTGKTTSLAKLAYKLKQDKISCVLVAADTFRAASIEQLDLHAQKLQVPIIKGQYGSDPTSVAFDGKQYAKKHKIQCVLIDTAGRMYTKENLVKEMEKLIRVIQPELKMFIGESIAGNDSIEQAKTFNEALKIDGIILSKADVDEKAGTILSVSQITGKPIYFLGTGQNYEDLEVFKKKNILKNLGLE